MGGICLRIRIACVGRLKEPYLLRAAEEYLRRLSRFAQVEVFEIGDEPVPERLSQAQRAQALSREGARLLKGLPEKEPVAALCIGGKRYTSEAFAAALSGALEAGGAKCTFVIGGSLGLSPEVLARANTLLSLSDLTFPHQLARILLLEQLYRACKINTGEPYHK